MKQIDLEKATGILAEIKALDVQISEINKMAQLAAEGEIKASFQLRVEDLAKQKEEAEKQKDGRDFCSEIQQKSLHSAMEETLRNIVGNHGFVHFGGRGSRTPKSELVLQQDCNEIITLEILGVILGYKLNIRRSLLAELEKLGVCNS